MYILPLVFTLLLLLAFTSGEKFAQLRNQAVVEKAYRNQLEREREWGMAEHARRLLHKKEEEYSLAQLSVRPLVRKDVPGTQEQKQQIRWLVGELMEVLFGHTQFFQELLEKRPTFVEELLDQIQSAAFALPKEQEIREITEISRLELADPQLQEAFYHMLKGTVDTPTFRTQEALHPLQGYSTEWSKTYPSLLSFLHNRAKLTISLHRAPKELLLAIFGKKEWVEKLMHKRNELQQSDLPHKGELFRQEFSGMQRPEIAGELLDFSFGKASTPSS